MKKRHELDPTFKQMLLKFLEPFPVTIETEVEVSRLPRTIDVIVVTQSEDAHEQLKLHTPFGHFRPYNQIEFKGMSDRLTNQNYPTILGRTYFYISEHKVAFTDMSVTIVCARKPITILDRRIPSHTFTEKEAGVYQNDGFPQVTIIVINELPLTNINIPLILFAGNEAKFREAVLQLLAENNVEYVSYALLIRPQQTQELAEMTNRYEENMKIIARDMGADMIKYIDPELRLEGISPELRLEGIEPKERKRIFDRFYRSPNSTYSDSSGIGLSLCKQYVEMHHGTIEISSSESVKTIFSIHLKKGKKHLRADELAPIRISNLSPDEEILETENFIVQKPSIANSKPSILLVEDNDDMRSFIHYSLKNQYPLRSQCPPNQLTTTVS